MMKQAMSKLLRKILVLSLILLPLPALGKGINLEVAKSLVLDMPDGITKVSIADPSVADVAVPSKRSLLLNGKKPGSTTLIVWTSKKRMQYDLLVKGEKVEAVDVELLKNTLKRALGKKIGDIKVDLVGNRILLSGKVEQSSQVEIAGKIASGFTENVVNLLAPETIPQVQVDVQIVELRKKKGQDIGVDWGSLRVDKSGEAVYVKDMMTFAETSPGQTLTFRQFDRLAAQLKLLVNEGQAKVLAKPNLVVVSGGKASFLVGGQIPIPQSQQYGQVTVSWRDYGVKLNVEPRVKENGRIALKVMPEVSSLDYNNAIKLNGFLIPSLSTRQAETEVILIPGEGLAIGGLLSNSESKNIDKFPMLGDIPVLGALFRSTQFQQEETELTILVTPRLITQVQGGIQ